MATASAACVGSPRPSRAADAGDPDTLRECWRRMGLILEAIRRWQRTHGADNWPDSLVMLRREGFLTDLRAWVCPVSEKIGDLRFNSRNPLVLSASEFNRESNYQYDFSPKPVEPDYLPRGQTMVYREWKTALASTAIGGRIPVLRCNSHGDLYLNLGLDGHPYPSGLYWEYLFADLRPEPYTMPWMVRIHPGPPGETSIPRPSGLPDSCLDLGPIANANPDLPWIDGYPNSPTLDTFLRETRNGANLTPHPFDARRLVQTAGLEVPWWKFQAALGFPGQSYPAGSRILPLADRPTRRILALAATAFRSRLGERVGDLVLGIRGQPTLHIPLTYGVHLGWWRDPSSTPARNLAWQSSPDSPPSAALFRVEIDLPSQTQTQNPNRNQSPVLESLELRANPASSASPFVLGITLVPH